MTSPAEFRRKFLQSEADQTSDFQKGLDAHRAKAEQLRADAQARLEHIASRSELTPEARRTMAARVYKPTCEQLNGMLDEHANMVNQHRQKLIDRAFGARGGDASTLMARRQAQQMAASLDESWKAMDALKAAQQDGDSQMAQVVAGHAYSRGWNDVVDQWNHDGSNNNAMRNVLESQQLPDTNDPQWRFSVAASFVPPECGPDLMGLREGEISNAAAGDWGGDAA